MYKEIGISAGPTPSQDQVLNTEGQKDGIWDRRQEKREGEGNQGEWAERFVLVGQRTKILHMSARSFHGPHSFSQSPQGLLGLGIMISTSQTCFPHFSR